MRTSTKTLRRLAVVGVAVAVLAALTCCNGGGSAGTAADAGAEQEAAAPATDVETDDAADTEQDDAADASADATADAGVEFGEEYWLGSCLAPQASEYGPSFTEGSLTETELSLYGTARVGATEDEATESERDWTEPRQWTYAVTDETVIEGFNAFGPNTAYPFDEAKEVIESMNGLGIKLHVQNGVVTYICFMS